ncbi:MAG: DUF1786 domain-containing protein [Desulfonauticus sp.]|nr:DUF1786 domain-containing protein [Desulfonauticus sp.]
MDNQNILCLDIGSGTQDVLLYSKESILENCPKFILPSPAMLLAQKIFKLTEQKRNIYLYGQNMGGGFKFALKRHLQQGLKVAVHKDAYFALSDNPEKVLKLGIEIVKEPPQNYVPLKMEDFSCGFWHSFLQQLDLNLPELILIAAQDHGFFPTESNRKGRFKLWLEFLKKGGDIYSLLYINPPEVMTRLTALKQSIGVGFVADTGAAAMLGALFVEKVENLQNTDPICVVNIGNSHTLAFLIWKNKVKGIYEHHTLMLSAQTLWSQLQDFIAGKLTNEYVFEDNGHGCVHTQEINNVAGIFVLGPRRNLLQEYNVEFLCPGGDMMLAGCFGLLKAYFNHKT